MAKPTEAELIQASLEKLRARRAAWIKKEYETVFGVHDLKKLSAKGLRNMVEYALMRGYCEGMAEAHKVVPVEAMTDAKATIARNPIFTVKMPSVTKH